MHNRRGFSSSRSTNSANRNEVGKLEYCLETRFRSTSINPRLMESYQDI
jgi:hypothetical protein